MWASAVWSLSFVVAFGFNDASSRKLAINAAIQKCNISSKIHKISMIHFIYPWIQILMVIVCLYDRETR